MVLFNFPLFTIELNYGILYAWKSRRLDTVESAREFTNLFLSTFKRLAFYIFINKYVISKSGYIKMLLIVVDTVLRHYNKLHVNIKQLIRFRFNSYLLGSVVSLWKDTL